MPESNADIFAIVWIRKDYNLIALWNAQPMAESYRDPFFDRLDEGLPAFFKGLPGGPHAFQARYMSIIRLFVIDNLIFSPCQGCRNVLREHIKISLYMDGFNIILVDSSMTQRVE